MNILRKLPHGNVVRRIPVNFADAESAQAKKEKEWSKFWKKSAKGWLYAMRDLMSALDAYHDAHKDPAAWKDYQAVSMMKLPKEATMDQMRPLWAIHERWKNKDRRLNVDWIDYAYKVWNNIQTTGKPGY